MTYSYTATSAFTKTDALYLASKVAADLRQIQRLYDYPPDDHIKAYIEEVVILMLGGFLGMVEYGFRKGDHWEGVACRYVARSSQLSGADDSPGRIPLGDIGGATWHSYLEYSASWWQLSEQQRAQIEATLPIKRTPGQEPRINGGWSLDRSYFRSGVSLERGVYSS